MQSKTKQVTCFIAAEVGNPEVERLRARLSERNVLCYLALPKRYHGTEVNIRWKTQSFRGSRTARTKQPLTVGP